MASSPTKLELHRLKYQATGGKHRLLAWSDLTDDERRTVSRDIFLALRSHGQDRDYYEIYLEVLMEWGIMCPHPNHLKTYIDRPHLHFRCSMCGTESAFDDGCGGWEWTMLSGGTTG